jgi:hypothetical protein
MPSGAQDLANDVLYDTAVLYVDIGGTSTPIGASRGGLTFSPGREFRTIEYDGLTSPGIGTTRMVGTSPQITGTFIELSENMVGVLEPGVTDTFQAATKRFTPKSARLIFADADHVAYARLVYQRANGGTYAYVLPRAICTTYEHTGQDKNESGVAITLMGVRTSVQGDDLIPYYIEMTGSDVTS